MADANSDLDLSLDDVDLTNCDREPIHILGRVQSTGALLAVSPDWLVNHASVNINEFLEIEAPNIIGSPVGEILTPDAVHDIRSKLQLLVGNDAVERIFGIALTVSGILFDVAIHLSGRSIIIEIERHVPVANSDYTAYVKPMMARIEAAKNTQALCDTAARQLRALIGFDRVMVYKFEENGSGTVVSESVRGSTESFMGLRYPASDIPKQARALYTRNLLRIIADATDHGVDIIPAKNPEGLPLDLSMSSIRAVSPIHLEYLKNMGVGASMSISILNRGKLWGLFACHNAAPKGLPYTVRSAAELFGQLFAFLLDQRESDEERADLSRARELHNTLMAQLSEGDTIADNLETVFAGISTVIPYDGAMGWIDGKFTSIGDTPTREDFIGLAKFLNTTAPSSIYTNRNIAAVYPPAENFADKTAGILAVPVSRSPRDYIVLCRRELQSTVNWAGNPEKPVTSGKFGKEISPRKSFEKWKQVVRNHSEPWTDAEHRIADALRITLLEVVLRISDASLLDRAKAQESQEILIAELNHRVRNILNLIKGLINQSSGDAKTIAEFTQIVGGRVHALARAHDQITQENWSPASIQDMILTEAAAYLDDKVSRLNIHGPDALLTPPAFTTVSLVIHELMTNSMKYGALSGPKGHVEVGLVRLRGGALVINWRESGGPQIKTIPTRKGFGTTIIERSIPFELKGEANISYKRAGLEADFVIPASFVPKFQKAEDKMPILKTRDLVEETLTGDVLVVEDNIIIAMDAEDIMKELGATTVTVAPDVSSALTAIGETSFAFALLDVNLGVETSEQVAAALLEKGTPFAFATGYGDAYKLTKQFEGVAVVQKPYERSSVANALAQMKSGRA
ncbi:GAF domain-containing protein [Hellea sp.]|nr:GAF domain-containing protein [Hellea sp.]